MKHGSCDPFPDPSQAHAGDQQNATQRGVCGRRGSDALGQRLAAEASSTNKIQMCRGPYGSCLPASWWD